MRLALVFQSSELEREELRLDQLSGHVGEFALRELKGSNWLVELYTCLGVVDRRLVAGARSTVCAPCDTVTRLVQAGEWAAQSTHIGKQLRCGNAAVGEVELAGD